MEDCRKKQPMLEITKEKIKIKRIKKHPASRRQSRSLEYQAALKLRGAGPSRLYFPVGISKEQPLNFVLGEVAKDSNESQTSRT